MAPALASDLAAGGFRPTPVIIAMRLEPEVERLQSAILAWIEGCSEEMHETLRWQFVGDAKYFRSMALFSCFRATHRDEVGEDEIRLALIIEIIHNFRYRVDERLDPGQGGGGPSRPEDVGTAALLNLVLELKREVQALHKKIK